MQADSGLVKHTNWHPFEACSMGNIEISQSHNTNASNVCGAACLCFPHAISEQIYRMSALCFCLSVKRLDSCERLDQ